MAGRVAASEIDDAVRRMFNRVAEMPTEKFRFGVGAALAREVGYADAVLAGVPPSVTESFTGLADLHPYLRLQPGEQVLDLGAGAGFDAVGAARAVSPRGSVTGLDMAEAMVAKARQAATLMGAANVTFERGEAESMPFGDATLTPRSSTASSTLCPDKPPVARELHRVLRPGGRAGVAEITFTDPLLATEARSIDDWFR